MKILQYYEPVKGNLKEYLGTYEEWAHDYESIRLLDLETMDDMEERIAAIMAKCERGDD